MKEFYTRRDVLKKAAKSIATGAVGLGSGATLFHVENSGSTQDVASVALMAGGVALVGAGLYASEMALTDNLPVDDKGNERELVGYGETKHFMVAPMPIYKDKKPETQG